MLHAPLCPTLTWSGSMLGNSAPIAKHPFAAALDIVAFVAICNLASIYR